MRLHLGVADVPYTAPPPARRRRRRATAQQVSTGDVATWLENRYHVMEVFYLEHEQDVGDDLAHSAAGAMQTILAGGPVTLNPFASAAANIEDRLKQFIATGEMERLGIPGVPTQASLDRASGKRRSARFKARRATGRSVSFIDSGLYQASIKAWVD
jgi:hypothetical protein